MKKIVSLLCIALILVSIFAVCANNFSAAEAAQTVVEVKSGDKVSYKLSLGGVNELIECAEFSVYYDSDALEIESIADYTDSTDEEEWASVINYELDSEIKASFINIKGVDFSKQRNFITVNFVAKSDASSHISYYVRDLAGESYFQDEVNRPEISEYLFTCDVTVNGEAVIEEARPELNVENTQSVGHFVNSVTGDSADADVNLVESGAKGTSNAVNNNGGSGSNSGAGTSDGSADGAPVTSTDAQGNVIAATDANGNVVTTTANNSSNSSSTWIWIIVAVVIVAAGCGIGVYAVKGKKKAE